MQVPDLFITDLHRRSTGVSATVRTLIPHIANVEPLALVSPRAIGDVQPLQIGEAIRLTRLPPSRSRPYRIWHVRRNNEMLLGLILKHFFRCKIRLVMTSCALRKHSWFPRQLLRSMDAIIATSKEAASFCNNVVATIPHGVDCNRFRPNAHRTATLADFGIPGRYGVGICGRVRPEKGTDVFVAAMIRLLPRYPGFTACIAGRTTPEFRSFQQSLCDQISAAGLEERFCWLDEIEFERMPEFYSSLSLCVAPARYEGFGLVALEAMACGVPIVGSRTGCYPDAILPGKTGDLVDCGDVDGLTESLDALMSAPQSLVQMGDLGRRRVVDHFSAELEARRIVAVYRQLWGEATDGVEEAASRAA